MNMFATAPHFQMEAPEAAPSGGPLPSREEIPSKYKWNLSDIYENDASFEKDYQKVSERTRALKELKGALSRPDALGKCLKLRDKLGIRLGKLFAYARMHLDADTKNAKYQAMAARVESLAVQFSSAAAFVEPELSAMPAKKLESLIAASADLAPYRFYMEDLLRQKSHVLSPAEEELLAGAGEVMKAPSKIFTIMTNADLKFPETLDASGNKIQLSEGRYNALIRCPDRAVRKDAFRHLFGAYADYRNTFATTLSSHIKNTAFYAKTKKYQSSLAASLGQTNVPIRVYENLIDTIQKNLAPLHRYVALKKTALGLERMHMYDLYAPLTRQPQAKYAYPDGLRLVLDSLAPLGKTYADDLKKGADSGWIDIYENRGKRSGAYSWGVYGVHPFVLLNYDGRYGAVSTLAHELGHAMHSYYSNQKQEYINASYTIFCAEVASTVNEVLLLDHMLKSEKDPKTRAYFINQHLEQVRTTVYRQAMFAEFELIAHRRSADGEALTADAFEELWLELNRKFYGESIVLDDEIKIEWARIPHFYRPFYVYQYTTGYAAATTLANALQTEGAPAQKRYLTYLSSGGSDYSIDLLKKAGVDMSSPAPLQLTLDKFSRSLEELERCLDPQ